LAHGELTPARYALERALTLFRPARVAARYGEIRRPDPRSATLILRDLAVRVRDLSGADREQALAILARPTEYDTDLDPDSYSTTEATPVCGTNVCVHYVTSTSDAVSSTDTTPANGVPDYVDQALDVFDAEVWGEEVTTLGYRPPKSDITSMNDGTSSADPTGAKFDVYLANLGDKGLYGYCTTDDPHLQGGYFFFDMSAYCVVDNNYTEPVFGAHSPLENLEVTAAHEFFHAIQFAYDAFEDQWLLEATATWMEDEVYTDVDDNLQYLVTGPLAKPSIPLDKGGQCCHVYGDWIFFRYLSEEFSTGLMRSIWHNADGSSDTDGAGPDGVGRDDYSIQAISRVLRSRGGFRARFAQFGWMNRIARVPGVYDEGPANHYPQSPLTASPMKLSKSKPSRSRSITLKHQTSAYYEFKRGSGVGRRAKLKVAFSLPSTSTGAAASALVFKKTGAVSAFTLGIPKSGDGTIKFGFGKTVSKIDIVLSNGSNRYKNCFAKTTPYACSGVSRDDHHTYELTGRIA
ncbi:MAG TPA: MXAN_6640 family putative metalloprotease, partial [Gaiellaceae bacterium]|nr:MXAN_6640 family putative metalloprotease [Gaiellaceae bacterium]